MLVGKYHEHASMPGFWDSRTAYSAEASPPSTVTKFPEDANPRALGHPALLYYKLDGCPYCRTTKPVMEKVAAMVGGVVRVYSIDAEERADLCRAMGVKSYPTIVYASPDGSLYEYGGMRTADAIGSFICQNSGRRHQFCRRQRY